jgi:hypothetical protein
VIAVAKQPEQRKARMKQSNASSFVARNKQDSVAKKQNNPSPDLNK